MRKKRKHLLFNAGLFSALFALASIFTPTGTGAGEVLSPQRMSVAVSSNNVGDRNLWPPYDPRWFTEVWQAHEVVTEQALRATLLAVPGQPFRIEQAREGPWLVHFLAGVFHITPRFHERQCLKIGLVRPESFSIIVEAPDQSLELRYHPHFYQTWAAYLLDKDSPPNFERPKRLALLATDGGRYRRSGQGSVMLFWTDRELVLSRGVLSLLRVPLAAPPRGLWLVGTTRLRELQWLEDVPPPPEATSWSEFPFAQVETAPAQSRPGGFAMPASLGWSLWEQSPEAELLCHEDGSVELAAQEAKKRVYAGFAIPESGLVEIVIQVSQATPGTGFFVADRQRRPIAGLGFFRRSGRDQIVFGHHSAQDDNWERGVDDNQVIPLVGGQQWFKLAVGAGIFKWWVSADGKHWSLAAPTAENCERPVASCGLFLTRGQSRRIRLQAVSVREAFDPRQWCDVTMLAQIPQDVYTQLDWNQWLEAVLRSCPDVELSQWVTACCVRTLQQNPPTYLAQRVLELLWDEKLSSCASLTEKLAASGFLAQWASPRDWGIYERLPVRMCRMMEDRCDREDFPAFSLLNDWCLRCPYWAEWRLPAFPESLFRYELFSALARNDEPHLFRLGTLVQWAAVPGSDVVSDSLRYLAAVALYRSRGGENMGGGILPYDFVRAVHPFPRDVGKSAYNFIQEVIAMLEHKDSRGAVQRILQSANGETDGYFPVPEDTDLWCDFSLYVKHLGIRFPEFAKAFAALSENIGQMELEQAKNSGREALAESVLKRMPGTEAAARAALWLGDRHLVLGRMAEALAYYETVSESAQGSLVEESQNRMRLVASLVPSLTFGKPPGTQESSQSERWFSVVQLPALKISQESIPPGVAIDSPGLRRPASVPEREFDWPRTQLTLTPLEDMLLVHTQSDIRAYAKDGTLLWGQQSALRGDQPSLPLIRMRPLLLESRIITRRLEQQGSELVCLDLVDGHVLWNSRAGGNVVSDPWIVCRDVYAMVASESDNERIELALVCLDPEQGKVRELKPLFQLRKTSSQPLDCQVTPLGPRFVAQILGTVFAGDVTGRLAWIRILPWVAPPSDSWWPSQPWYYQGNPPPLVCGDTVIATARGSWTISGISLHEGRLKWCRPLGEFVDLLGQYSGRIYVKTQSGLALLDAASGKLLAKIEHPGVDEWLRVHNPDALVALRWVEAARHSQPARLEFTWYRIDNGACVGYTTVPLPEKRVQWVGPAIRWDNHLLIFTGHSSRPTVRESVQVSAIPDGEK